MPSFTMELYRVIEFRGDFANFVGDYPIHDPEYRPLLNQKIVNHFWNREIGMESPDQFIFALKRLLNEKMPYYTLLYQSLQIEYDPLITMKLHTTGTGEAEQATNATGTSENTSANNSGSRAVNSQFPQQQLQGDGDYADSASDVTSAATGTGSATNENSSTGNTSQSSSSDVVGYQGSPTRLIMEYRASLMNVDEMILNMLEECFMQVWSSGDSIYTNERYYY